METPAALPLSALPPPLAGVRPSPLFVLVAFVLTLSFVAAAIVVGVSGLTPDIAGFSRFAAMAAVMLGLSAWCARRGLDPRVGDAALIVGTGTLSLLVCGVVSNAGLRLGFPLADANLASIDGAAGIDVGLAIEAIAAIPWLTAALSAVYNSTGAAVIGVIFIVLLLGDRNTARELTATAVVSMQVVAMVSIFYPAWGAMRHFGLESLQGDGLPAGAGTYQWPAFAHFYEGADPLLKLSDMGGIVAFPSFHTVLALMITQAFARGSLKWPATAWTAAIIVSAVPMGGHYVADLVAGFVVWALALAAVKKCGRNRPHSRDQLVRTQ